jgi:hypothetical protein
VSLAFDELVIAWPPGLLPAHNDEDSLEGRTDVQFVHKPASMSAVDVRYNIICRGEAPYRAKTVSRARHFPRAGSWH